MSAGVTSVELFAPTTLNLKHSTTETGINQLALSNS